MGTADAQLMPASLMMPRQCRSQPGPDSGHLGSPMTLHLRSSSACCLSSQTGCLGSAKWQDTETLRNPGTKKAFIHALTRRVLPALLHDFD